MLVNTHIDTITLCFITTFLLFFSTGAQAEAGRVDTVLIISIDALHPDALSAENSPNIWKLMKQGKYTLDGHSTQPPLTLVAHSAMFTGIGPDTGGRTDNTWQEGRPSITLPTIFDTAKDRGYSTGFFYSKQKLGFLVSPAMDRHKQNRDFSSDLAMDFIDSQAIGPQTRTFCFLHVSGLDRAGPLEGWLSLGYMEELKLIDDSLAPLFDRVQFRDDYLLIITSDHSGHQKIHGTSHPEDQKLPFILISDSLPLNQFQGASFQVTDLKTILDGLLDTEINR